MVRVHSGLPYSSCCRFPYLFSGCFFAAVEALGVSPATESPQLRPRLAPPNYNQNMTSDAMMQHAPFERGAMVVVSLNSPREKFWGGLLALSVAGISLRGITLESLEDFAHQLKMGERADPGLVFFPMHRVERIELDTRNGEVPSLAERFFSKSGLNAIEVFCREVGE